MEATQGTPQSHRASQQFLSMPGKLVLLLHDKFDGEFCTLRRYSSDGAPVQRRLPGPSGAKGKGSAGKKKRLEPNKALCSSSTKAFNRSCAPWEMSQLRDDDTPVRSALRDDPDKSTMIIMLEWRGKIC